jgi:DNA excision repair protein ERCC-2
MNAVCVVGVPFQRPMPSLEAMITYYEARFPKKGRLFAYTVPAFEKSNQACGRPIRRLTDKGAVILMDDRFKTYGDLLSNWVRENFREVPNTKGVLSKMLKVFFKEYCGENSEGSKRA